MQYLLFPVNPVLKQRKQAIDLSINLSDNVNSSYVNAAFNETHEMEERGVDSKTTAERMGYEMYNGRPHVENR